MLKVMGQALSVFGGVMIVLANKSIMTHSFALLSVLVMISSLNYY